MDSEFDVAGWFAEAAGDEIAKAEGVAFIAGNGTPRPTGILNTAPSSAGDSASPARNNAAIQHLPTGVADGFGTLSLTSPEHHPADVLFDVIYSLKADFRRNAVWQMNSATAGVIRKFKDADGRHLWSDPLSTGQPPLLAGFPVMLNEQVPDIGTNAHPVLFGDFDRGYVIADHGGIRITIDDNITTPGRVKWHIRRRVGGCVLDNDAIEAVKIAAT